MAPMSDDWPPSAGEALRSAREQGRTVFVDGEPWRVFEMPPSQFDRRHAPSLVFEADHTMRRVRNFPAKWRDLSDEDLFALSWSH
jgi:hypothetical protein